MSILHHNIPTSVDTGQIPFDLLLQSEAINGSTVFTDSSGNRVITVYPTIFHTTNFSKFGSSSIYGNTGYLTAETVDLANHDFTIDFWLRMLDVSNAYLGLFQVGTGDAFRVAAYFRYFDIVFNGVRITASIYIPHSAWTHFAIIRQSGAIHVCKNGIYQESPKDGSFTIPEGILTIGRAAGYSSGSWFEEFAIRLGAVWNCTGKTNGDAVFTPPTAAYEA